MIGNCWCISTLWASISLESSGFRSGEGEVLQSCLKFTTVLLEDFSSSITCVAISPTGRSQKHFKLVSDQWHGTFTENTPTTNSSWGVGAPVFNCRSTGWRSESLCDTVVKKPLLNEHTVFTRGDNNVSFCPSQRQRSSQRTRLTRQRNYRKQKKNVVKCIWKVNCIKQNYCD